MPVSNAHIVAIRAYLIGSAESMHFEANRHRNCNPLRVLITFRKVLKGVPYLKEKKRLINSTESITTKEKNAPGPENPTHQ